MVNRNGDLKPFIRPIGTDFGDWLFLVRQAVSLEAAYQEARDLGSSDKFFDSNAATRKAFWAALRLTRGFHAPIIAGCFLTTEQESRVSYRERCQITRACAEKQARYESYWIERQATVSAANFAARLAQPQRPILEPNIGDPAYRADFMRRHGLTPAPMSASTENLQ